MATDIALKIASQDYMFVSGTAAIVPFKTPIIFFEKQSASPVPESLSNELAHALVAGASDQVSLPLVNGWTRKFQAPESENKLLVVLTDVGIQRKGGGEVIHVPGLHVGIFEVTQEVRDRGVLEIVVPIKKIIRITVLDKHGCRAPNQRLSIWGSNEQPDLITAVRSNQQGECVILGTVPGHYVVETDEGESAIVQVDARDLGEEVEVTLRKQN